MGVQERKAREKRERERQIVECARRIADEEGWEAVTTRRLAAEIEYSPPVLYGHFPDGRDGIVSAVALAGFVDFTQAMRAVLTDTETNTSTNSRGAELRLAAFIDAYLAFVAANPAAYDAMFSLGVSLRFAADTTPTELRDAFDVLVDVLGRDRTDSASDVEIRAELLWSALHGMAVLTRGHRLPPETQSARVAELARLFSR